MLNNVPPYVVDDVGFNGADPVEGTLSGSGDVPDAGKPWELPSGATSGFTS
jgi:hypothetical protein